MEESLTNGMATICKLADCTWTPRRGRRRSSRLSRNLELYVAVPLNCYCSNMSRFEKLMVAVLFLSVFVLMAAGI